MISVFVMDVIKIPRFSIWHEEYAVYEIFSEFVHLADRLGHGRRQTGNAAAPVVVLRQLAEVQKLPFEDIDSLFTALKDAAFAYKPPEYKLLKELYSNSLFTPGSLSKCDKQRAQLKRLTKLHTEFMVNLMECQEQCWKSRDKLKQHVSMLECAQMSLPYYEVDKRNYTARKFAIKELKKDVSQKQKIHSRNVGEYLTVLTDEQNIRHEMHEVAGRLEEDFKGKLKESLVQAWTTLCRATQPSKFKTILDPDLISQCIYDLTCKTYMFITPANDLSSPDFNEKIQRPRLQDSIYYITNVRYRSYGGSCCQCATVREDIECAPENFLRLKKGDKIKVKLISTDMENGFGYYRNSKLSVKKWGFIFLSNVLFDESDLE